MYTKASAQEGRYVIIMWGRKTYVPQVVRDEMPWEFRLGGDISWWEGVGVSLQSFAKGKLFSQLELI